MLWQDVEFYFLLLITMRQWQPRYDYVDLSPIVFNGACSWVSMHMIGFVQYLYSFRESKFYCRSKCLKQIRMPLKASQTLMFQEVSPKIFISSQGQDKSFPKLFLHLQALRSAQDAKSFSKVFIVFLKHSCLHSTLMFIFPFYLRYRQNITCHRKY